MLTDLAFTLAYRKYSEALVRASVRLTNGSADAEDVAQDAWAEAWKARKTIELPGLWAWLRSVMRRVWWWRLNPKRKPVPAFAPIEDAGERATEGGQVQAAQVAQIAHAAASLGAGQHRAVRFALAGFDSAETAKAAGVSTSAVTETLRKAVRALRAKWRIE